MHCTRHALTATLSRRPCHKALAGHPACGWCCSACGRRRGKRRRSGCRRRAGVQDVGAGVWMRECNRMVLQRMRQAEGHALERVGAGGDSVCDSCVFSGGGGEQLRLRVGAV
eukprot:1147901-Pelagomonas_calceolata.AAC.1